MTEAYDEIIKKYGDGVRKSGLYLVENPKPIISVSPKLDLILGGGIPMGSFVIFTGPPKCGKDQPLDSIVYTPAGPKRMGDIVLGDVVCSPNCDNVKVIGIFPQGKQKVYKVTFANGDSVECGQHHLWEVYNRFRRNKQVLSTQYISDTIKESDGRPRWGVLPSICEFKNEVPDIDPYLLGYLLGDGCLTNTCKTLRVSCDNIDILNILKTKLYNGYKLKYTSGVDYYLTSQERINRYKTVLRQLGLLGTNSYTKFIPERIKYSPLQYRLDVIRGLMDSDGTVGKNGYCTFSTCSKQLAYDFKDLIQSIGGIAQVFIKKGLYKGKRHLSYRVSSRVNDTSILFYHKDKLAKCKVRTKKPLTKKIVSIEYIGDKETQCIKVDNKDGLYVTNHFTTTHNTVTSLHFAAKAQQAGMNIHYNNIEGRIKPRDLLGIAGLDVEKVNIIESVKGRILSGGDYLSISRHLINNDPRSVIILDSVSQITPENELNKEDTDGSGRSVQGKMLGEFCRQICNVLPVNECIVICITHLHANTSGYGSPWSEGGGNKIKYQVDVKLRAKTFKDWKVGSAEAEPIGQTVTWETESTAIIAPGKKTDSYIRYGLGIDEVYEWVDLALSLAIIKKAGAWYSWNDTKAQGQEKLCAVFKESPELLSKLQTEIKELLG